MSEKRKDAPKLEFHRENSAFCKMPVDSCPANAMI